MRNSRFFGAAVLALGLSTAMSSAATVQVEVEGAKWDVSAQSGLFSDLSTTLSAQPWWENDRADDFASKVGAAFGVLNFDGLGGLVGPLFAVSQNGTGFVAFASRLSGGPVVDPYEGNVPWAFAVATLAPAVVPLPAGGLLLLTGLAAAAAVGKRRKGMKVQSL